MVKRPFGRRSRDPDGRMTLVEHLRELRSRLVISIATVLIFAIIAYAFHQRVTSFLEHPAQVALKRQQAKGHNVQLAIVGGVTGAFNLQIKIALIMGIIAACPVWLYQIWRFVTPGLRRNERRYGLMFVGAATPLFLAGVTFAYLFLPRGIDVLAGFTPKNTTNIIKLDQYISFVIQISLFVGVGFVLPVIVVALNAVGIVSSRRLWGWWRQVVFLVFLFAAIATPSGNPVNLALLAFPILVLVFTAMGIASLNDRRKRRRSAETGYDQWDDDETSPMPEATPEADYSDLT
jgi:sec-independent protein translocase protein TatC